MKLGTSLLLTGMLAGSLVGCEKNNPSKLDQLIASNPVTKTPTATSAEKGPAAATPIDSTGSLEERVARLEAFANKNAEALDFLGKVYAQQKQQQDAQEREEPAPDAIFAVDISNDIKMGQVEGPANAEVTIIKAFDFACPYCRRVSGTMDELVKDYNGKVRVVYKNLVVHPQVATPAHLASCAAAKQGKYAEFKDAVWVKGFDAYAAARDPSKLNADNMIEIAKGIGLDTAKLKADMDGKECKDFVDADMKELEKFKVNSTPTFFINGTHVGGALPKEEFKKIIDEKIKLAEASGVPAGDYYDKEVMGKGEKQFRSKMDPKPN
ncbi:MAG TPA: thioredoxin domain-containing protein [Kofleriaceae bacterium]